MFLKNLKIQNANSVIRDIPFHKGINLIVDETKPENKIESGNSVGKTTVLRLIDYCLDGEGKNIYIDPEFKNTNTKIEEFLKKNNIIITLTLIADIDDENSETIEIRRNFLSGKNKIQEINQEKYSNGDFAKELKKHIFNSTATKPTFKQLKSKNIRDEKNKLINTLKVLSPYTSDAEYEALFLFWFGIDVDSRKDKLVRDKNLEVKLQTRLKKEANLSQIMQSLIIINKEIEELAKRKKSFNVNEKFEQDLNKLNEVKFEINKTSTLIGRLEIRKELITESRIDLEKDITNIDTTQIMRMYEKAKSYFPIIQKSFEETLNFHNGMIKEKVAFITEELPQIEKELNESKRSLNVLLIQEKSLAESLEKTGAVEDLQRIIDSLNEFHEKKGNFEEQKRLWESTNENLRKIDIDLEAINKNIYSKDELIQQKMTEFNEYFSSISSRLDGMHSVLSADKSDGIYKLKIGNIEGNPGTGSKKSQMASFDLAYIKFADSAGIPCLHFVLQDQIENVHSNQITNLLTEIVGEVKCQYVLSVLRDKLPKDIDVEQFEIVSLSQKNKLFRVV